MINYKTFYDETIKKTRKFYNIPNDINVKVNKKDDLILCIKHNHSIIYHSDYIYLGSFQKKTKKWMWGNKLFGINNNLIQLFNSFVKQITNDEFTKLLQNNVNINSPNELMDILTKSLYYSRGIMILSDEDEINISYYIILNVY